VKYGFFSDAHGDFSAVEDSIAALSDAEEILFLGDCAGERDSEKCIMSIRERSVTALTGNHDRWIFETKGLSRESLNYLETLPLSLEREGFLAIHSDYDEKGGEIFFQYVQSSHECEKVFSRYSQHIIFMGHTHAACVNQLREGVLSYIPVRCDIALKIDDESRYIINVGMACDCAVFYDSKEKVIHFRFHRRNTIKKSSPARCGLIHRLLNIIQRSETH